MRRVVITGCGTVNPLGLSAAESFDSLRAGRGAIGPLQLPGAERLSIRIGAPVKGFAPAAPESPSRSRSMRDPVSEYALAAAAEAMAAAGLEAGGESSAGVIIGCAGGGMRSQDDAYRAVHAEGRNRVHPFTVPRLMASAPASHVSIAFGLTGPSYSVSTACAAANHAIGQAFHLIRSGGAPLMLAGGAEAMLCFGGIKAWEGLRVLSPDGCRPFCGTRNGMVLGEGAALFVLEELEHARARGAPVLAEIAGFAMGADAGDMVQPDLRGATRCIRAALADARLDPGDIDHVNAHGTATRANDRIEAAALCAVFGPRGGGIPVTATKSLHGHLIGAAGAVELLAVLLALREGVIAPTIGLASPDPDCPLELVAGSARETPVAAAISNAFAFGGLNAVLVLKRL